jgi:hypothetical protein
MRVASLLTAVLFLGVATSAQAASEDFTGYTPGDLGSQGGWDTSGIQGSDTITVVDSALTGPAGSESSVAPHLNLSGSGNFGTDAELLVSGLGDANNTGAWLGAIYNAVPGGYAEVVLASGAMGGFGGNEVMGIGIPWQGTAIEGRYGAGGLDSGLTIAAVTDGNVTSTAVHVLIQYDPDATGEELKMWIDPDLTQPAGTPTATASSAGLPEAGAIDRVVVRLGGPTSQMVVDNLYYGTDSPFIPEPASLALVGLGGLALLARRKRA